MDVLDTVAVTDYFNMLERMMRTNTHRTHPDKVRETIACLSHYESKMDQADLTFLNICRHYHDEQLEWKNDIQRLSR